MMLRFIPVDMNGFSLLKVDFYYAHDIFERAFSTAMYKSEHISIFDPSGTARSKDEVISQNFMGALADLVCYRLIGSYFKKNRFNIDVVRYDDVRIDGFKNHDQYDLKVVNAYKEEYVEVRSSVCVKMPLSSMVKKWHMLGPYSSSLKGDTEHFSKYYIRPVYHLDNWKENIAENIYRRKDGMHLIRNGAMSLYILGGATFDTFKGIGWEENGETIKQNKANYLVINITDGLVPKAFLDKIAADFK